MIFGLSPFTFLHVVISLIGIVSGLVVLYGLLGNKRMPGLTLIFLGFTLATSVTSFLFPINGFTPALGTGIVSMLALLPALAALYLFNLRGAWRRVYVIGAMAALYLNCFVLVVQAFLKIPALHALAPSGSEPPFAVAQGLVLIFFIVSGYLAVKRFHPITFAAR